ncbi:hypothetical protein D9757_004832 [Collybiopsis confluens]|uniref:RING-type domain-containing protein n=1 Tax=Collybiopsis confluens TaxID=2823264 RepID=A0A8H5HSV1_9AGAR|nr:hypothetical protein D9757_004832 [Collybiopsis confluens]
MKSSKTPSLSVSIQDLYPDKFSVESDDEYDDSPLNLGAESMAPTPPPEPLDSSYFPTTFLPPKSLKPRKSRSLLSPSPRALCALCSKQAVRPARTTCCQNIFCEEHIRQRLDNTSKRCPSCSSDYSFAPVSSTVSSLRQQSRRESDSSDESSRERDTSVSTMSESDTPESPLQLRSFQRSIIDSDVAGLAGGMMGRVLSIVALTLVFYVLFS